MINLILITHEGVASSILRIAEDIIDIPIKDTTCFEVAMDADTDAIIEAASRNIETTGLDTLILTDLIGSTPYNIATRLSEATGARVVSGLNLPMLLKVLNYRAYRLEEIADMAVDGGRKSIQAS